MTKNFSHCFARSRRGQLDNDERNYWYPYPGSCLQGSSPPKLSVSDTTNQLACSRYDIRVELLV